jgi:hypothetical protein
MKNVKETERIMLNVLEEWILFMLEISSACPNGIPACSNTEAYGRCRYAVGGTKPVRTVVLRIPIQYLLMGTSKARSMPMILGVIERNPTGNTIRE